MGRRIHASVFDGTHAYLFFGRIIGAVLIVIGLYFVLWGKSAEKKAATRNNQQDQLEQRGGGGGDMERHLLGGGDAPAKDEEAPAIDLLA